MAIVLNGAAVLVALLAAYLILCNDMMAVMNLRNRFRGIDRYHSSVFLLPQLAIIIAELFSALAEPRLIPRATLVTIALLDAWFLANVVWFIVWVWRRIT